MPRFVLMVLLCGVLVVSGVRASTGITGLTVFGDSLCDAGNLDLLAAEVSRENALPTRSKAYHPGGRATNGRVWIERVAAELELEAIPSLAGGTNFAFMGAEAAIPSTGRIIPGFQVQIQMWRQARLLGQAGPMDADNLVVVWFGLDTFQRIYASEKRRVSVPEIQALVRGIASGVATLHREGARTFLVPSLPPLELTPFGQALPPRDRKDLATKVERFNNDLESALVRIENALSTIRILRLDTVGVFTDIQARPEVYGFTNVSTPAYYPPADIKLTNWEDQYLFWDSVQPTESGHAAIAAVFLDSLPVRPWWGSALERNLEGEACLGIGRVDDQNWPWVFCQDVEGGTWLWINGLRGSLEGFHAYRPDRSQWIFLNAASGWSFDYGSGKWTHLIP